jgi:predicted PurR-regulated permease PerM
MALPVWVTPLSSLFVAMVALALFLYFFSAISTVLLGLLAASIVVATLQPLLRFVPVPKGLAAVLVGLGAIGLVGLLIYGLSYPLADPIRRRIQNWPIIEQKTNQFLQTAHDRFRLTDQPLTMADLLGRLGNFLAGEGGQRLFSRSADLVLGLFLTVALVCFGSMFLLADPPRETLESGLRILSERHRTSLRNLMADLSTRFRRWVMGTITGMGIVFTASMVGYSLIGLEAALPLALLAGVAEIVPTVGPATACVIATLFAVATEGGPKAVGVLAVYGVIQAFEAYLILPMIMRGAVNIHPAVTLFSVVLWGKIFGVPGLVLAIPINLTLWAVIDHFVIRPREDRQRKAAPAAQA